MEDWCGTACPLLSILPYLAVDEYPVVALIEVQVGLIDNIFATNQKDMTFTPLSKLRLSSRILSPLSPPPKFQLNSRFSESPLKEGLAASPVKLWCHVPSTRLLLAELPGRRKELRDFQPDPSGLWSLSPMQA